ncbi:CRISPR-associated protein, Csd1 family [Caloramator quimbayensis]|uniref:CRISPR-associated protein, Csd1 family n=1 Tax=Caloramator quimbayensis TaxID=1147123 RepID=A0A1T4WLL5_9CLOT|nr:type I-C CRISPR-associated protein Cas8c/Csd1 [Caloramator quimbayensis]SKA78250.1 CRISPR-associated protein, Csd1 family [Caloramator quimbayensis]
MIIESLCRYYDIISSDGEHEVPLIGYSRVKVSFALILSEEGELLDIADLREKNNKGKVVSYPYMIVPEQSGRSGTAAIPYFLCDNSQYVLGIGKDKKADAVKKYKAFKELHLTILKDCEDPFAKAIVNFLNKWDEKSSENNAAIKKIGKEILGGNIVFKLDGYTGFVHEREEIKKLIIKKEDTKEKYIAQCLVTGKEAIIPEKHIKIKGVKGTAAESPLISINSPSTNAYDSYGKSKAYNAPIGEEAVFKYSTALNYLLSSKSSYMILGDDTIVYFAESSKSKYNDIASYLISPPLINENEKKEDKNTKYIIRDVLNCVKNGEMINSIDKDIDDNVKFYILGLSPNAGRISVRFFYFNSFGNFVKSISQHYIDMEIDGGKEYIPLWLLLNETVPKKNKDKKISPILVGQVMNSIITGCPYPFTLYANILNRIRAESDDRDKKIYSVNSIRVSIIKAYLLRKERKLNINKYGEVLNVSLNEESKNQAYLLGRLFAILEKVQELSSKNKLNSTIKDRFFSTASASPSTVFPSLIRLSQHHFAKIDNSKWLDIKMSEVLDKLEGFPAHLDMEEQGIFILGYYHQRQDFFKKKVNIEEESKNE